MKKDAVKIGSVYAMKVGKNTVGIRIISQDEKGAWLGVNVNTSKEVVIKSADRLCGLYRPKAAKKATIKASSGKKEPQEIAADTTVKKERKPGGLGAAVQVLQEAGEPLNCQEIVKRMLEKGLWETSGKTPSQTIYSAIITEIKKKGTASRFRKAERGKFELNK